MENKYYVPSIEEFCVGFEYEELFQDKPIKMRTYSKEELKAFPYNWIKLILDTSHSISRITSKIKQNKVRVKYLDREDIESLGWKIKYTNETTWFEIHNPSEPNTYLSQDMWYLRFINFNKPISITRGIYKYDRFLGTIKNKSELKKLMKQLGIWKD